VLFRSNSGNSGGVLVNMSGEVIGITNAKVSDVGVEGMGYAININSAMMIINGLMAEMAAA
jgi:serine protease Do